jgi:hypothetical protein
VEDENRSQDNLPYVLSSAIEEERAVGRTCFGELQRQREKLTICLLTPMVENGGESKSHNDDDERCGTRVREQEPLTIRAVIVDQA